jgi:uncharacterized protein
MIAPAMNTGPEDCLAYRDLARQEGRIQRSVKVTELPRICALLDPDPSVSPLKQPHEICPPDIKVDLKFRLDDDALAWVEGQAEGSLSLLCHRCAERVEFPLCARFDLCIVAQESVAQQYAHSRDLLMVEGSSVTIAEIIEDELLLALPEWLCSSEPCERMPALAYPAEGEPEAGPVQAGTADQDNPFAVLKHLKVSVPEENEDR